MQSGHDPRSPATCDTCNKTARFRSIRLDLAGQGLYDATSAASRLGITHDRSVTRLIAIAAVFGAGAFVCAWSTGIVGTPVRSAEQRAPIKNAAICQHLGFADNTQRFAECRRFLLHVRRQDQEAHGGF
jgi:hypothetical protein